MSDQLGDEVEVLRAAARVLTGVALRSLDDLGQARSARVAEALGLEASTVARLADRLVGVGYVVRGPT